MNLNDCGATPAALEIVVVDDNADITEMMSALLESYGHHVRVASRGSDVLGLLLQELPDVVLLDVGLPDMDGYQVAASVRSRFGAAIRLVALTGLSGRDARARASMAGFDAFLVKPLRLEDVSTALGNGAS